MVPRGTSDAFPFGFYINLETLQNFKIRNSKGKSALIFATRRWVKEWTFFEKLVLFASETISIILIISDWKASFNLNMTHVLWLIQMMKSGRTLFDSTPETLSRVASKTTTDISVPSPPHHALKLFSGPFLRSHLQVSFNFWDFNLPAANGL